MKTYIKILMLGLIAGASACVDESVPTAEDTLLDFEVPDTPATVNYTLGAKYGQFAWNTNVSEKPVIGYYDGQTGDHDVYDQHVSWATEADIDFFIMNVRSGIVPAQRTADSAFVANLQGAPSAANINFALSYSFGEMGLNENSYITDTQLDQMVADFVSFGDFMNEANYQETSDGKKIVYVQGASALFADDYQFVYDSIRAGVQAQNGFELYIIGQQQEWTPPMRFKHKFENKVDAVSLNSHIHIFEGPTNSFYDRYLLFEQYVDLGLRTISDEWERVGGAHHIPQLSPSIDPSISSANSNFLVVERDLDRFRTYCNSVKRATTAAVNPENIIIIDSFNDWNSDKQIEPAESYAMDYLDIIKSEFTP